MSDLEKYAKKGPVQKQYSTEKRKYQTPEIKIDEETERTLVSVISAAIVATPAAIILGKMLPEIPIYEIYKYFPF